MLCKFEMLKFMKGKKYLTFIKKECILQFFIKLIIKRKGGYTIMTRELYHKLGDDFNSFFWKDVEIKVKDYIKDIIELGLEDEIFHHIKGERYERFEERNDFRNGYYERKLNTTLGKINLRIPRTRSGTFQSKIIPKYSRNTGRFDRAILESFINGISTRRMKRITQSFSEIGISHGTVSNIFREIDINKRTFHQRPLSDKYKYMLLDGLWCSVYEKWHFKRVILVAMGITADGRQEIIDFRIAKSEAEMYWVNFLDDLRKRGLTGENLKLVTHDDSKAIRAAVNMVYPYIKTQLCIYHKIKSIVKYIKKHKNKYQLLRDASSIYKQPSAKLIIKKANQFRKKWAEKEPKVLKIFFKDFELTLNYLNYPKEDRVLIRTTSRLERANRYLRERTKNLGCFKGVKSLERFAYIVFFDYNERNIKKEKRKTPKTPKKKEKGGY